ncbi:MAG: alcohol dehydrogenase catalytic domain-containing protein [Desulfococcaceae bacterium]
MKALRLHEPGRLSLEETAEPAPCPEELVLRVTHCAICRTDAKMWRMGHRDLIPPRILGHELVGEGPDRVRYAVWPGIACGRCPACRGGAENLCPEMRIVGFHRDGGFAEHVAVPKAGLLPVPPEVPGTVACLAEPLACAINGLDQTGVRSGDRTLVFGAGPLGLLIGLAARHRGAEPVIWEIRPDRLAETRAFRDRVGVPEDAGASTGYDAALNAAPAGSTIGEGLARLRPGGRFCLFSGLTGGSPPSLADLNRIHYRQLTVTGAYGCTRDGMRKALQILAECPNEAALLVEAEVGLAEVPELLPTILEGRGLRRVIRPG